LNDGVDNFDDGINDFEDVQVVKEPPQQSELLLKPSEIVTEERSNAYKIPIRTHKITPVNSEKLSNTNRANRKEEKTERFSDVMSGNLLNSLINSEQEVELVKWIKCKTRRINLSILAEKDGDCYKTMLSEVPLST